MLVWHWPNLIEINYSNIFYYLLFKSYMRWISNVSNLVHVHSEKSNKVCLTYKWDGGRGVRKGYILVIILYLCCNV